MRGTIGVPTWICVNLNTNHVVLRQGMDELYSLRKNIIRHVPYVDNMTEYISMPNIGTNWINYLSGKVIAWWILMLDRSDTIYTLESKDNATLKAKPWIELELLG